LKLAKGSLGLAAVALLHVELMKTRVELMMQRAHPDIASIEFC